MTDQAAARWLDLTGRSGPDFFASFRLDEQTPGALREAVARIGLAGFERFTRRDEPMHSELAASAPTSIYDLYVDRPHADPVVRNLDGVEATQVWHYQTVMVGPGLLWIELGYSSCFLDIAEAIVRLLRGLLDEPSLALTGFEILAGGQGYPATPLASGRSGDELRAVLSL